MSVRPIILGEDNDKLRRLYATVLESAGYHVMCAVDGEKAVALLHKIVNPQLIILDIMMPRMDGIQACRRIRMMQGLRPCPVIFLTALDNPEAMLECLIAGGDDFVMKSAGVNEITERVRFWVRHGTDEEMAERRAKAIHELEAIIAARDMVDPVGGEELFVTDTLINELAASIEARAASLDCEPNEIGRFGYMVGLFENRAPASLLAEQPFHRALRRLVFKTRFIEPKEIDALLGNYTRIIQQGQFKAGWAAGSEDATKLAPGERDMSPESLRTVIV